METELEGVLDEEEAMVGLFLYIYITDIEIYRWI